MEDLVYAHGKNGKITPLGHLTEAKITTSPDCFPSIEGTIVCNNPSFDAFFVGLNKYMHYSKYYHYI